MTPNDLVAEVDTAASRLKELSVDDSLTNEQADEAAACAIRGFAALAQLAARALALRARP